MDKSFWFNPTIIVALLTTASAVFAPVLTAWINNRHQYRMRKLELIQVERIRAIQEYVQACSDYFSPVNQMNGDQYFSAYGKIFLYADKIHWDTIQKIHADVLNGDFQAASDKLANICQALSDDLRL